MPETGPHVVIAVICERVLTEQDGVLSLIRVVNRVTNTATGPDPPKKMPPLLVRDLSMVIALKADRARGRFSVSLIGEDPMGVRTPLGEQDVNLSAGNRGVNLVSPLQFALQHEGVYWIDVLLGGPEQEDELLTRVPLEVQYQRQVTRAPRTEG
jgi:hypothetical protein